MLCVYLVTAGTISADTPALVPPWTHGALRAGGGGRDMPHRPWHRPRFRTRCFRTSRFVTVPRRPALLIFFLFLLPFSSRPAYFRIRRVRVALRSASPSCLQAEPVPPPCRNGEAGWGERLLYSPRRATWSCGQASGGADRSGRAGRARRSGSTWVRASGQGCAVGRVVLVERSGEGGGDAECRGWAIRASLTYTDVAFDLHFRVAERREGGRRGELRAAFCRWSSRRRSDPAMGAGRRGEVTW